MAKLECDPAKRYYLELCYSDPRHMNGYRRVRISEPVAFKNEAEIHNANNAIYQMMESGVVIHVPFEMSGEVHRVVSPHAIIYISYVMESNDA